MSREGLCTFDSLMRGQAIIKDQCTERQRWGGEQDECVLSLLFCCNRSDYQTLLRFVSPDSRCFALTDAQVWRTDHARKLNLSWQLVWTVCCMYMKQNSLKGQRDACMLHWQGLQKLVVKINKPAPLEFVEILEYKKKCGAFFLFGCCRG